MILCPKCQPQDTSAFSLLRPISQLNSMASESDADPVFYVGGISRQYPPCQRVRQATERRHHQSSIHPPQTSTMPPATGDTLMSHAQSLNPGVIKSDLQRHMPWYTLMVIVSYFPADSTNSLASSLVSWLTPRGGRSGAFGMNQSMVHTPSSSPDCRQRRMLQIMVHIVSIFTHLFPLIILSEMHGGSFASHSSC